MMNAADALRRILSPIAIPTFVRRYFAREALHIAGRRDRLRGLFDREAFDRAIARHNGRVQIRAQLGKGGSAPLIDITPNQVPGILRYNDCTICVSKIHLFDPHLAEVAEAVRDQLQFAGPVGFHCYLSRGRSGLAAPHTDSRIATTLQIEGVKQWRFARRPSEVWPQAQILSLLPGDIETSAARAPGPPPAVGRQRLTRVLLEPGDVLCLPAGAVHCAEASGYSLSLNLYFESLTFLDLLYSTLRPVLLREEYWRHPPPVVLSRTSGCPEEVATFLSGRVAALRELLATGARIEEALQGRWRALVPARVPDSREQRGRSLRRQDILEICGSIHWTNSSRADGEIVVRAGDVEARLPLEALPFVRALARRRRFRAESTMKWGGRTPYTWREMKPLLEMLLDGGMLRVVAARP